MTSLEFFPRNSNPPQIPFDWGTGKSCKAVAGPPDDHAPPSWHYTNQPNENPVYEVSGLKLSNNRLNDELIPRPEHFDASQVVIRKPFPAEHPYSSHISRFSVFPSSTIETNSDEQKRATPQVIVLQKTKGFGARVEKVVGINRNFSWPENDFDQIPRGCGPRKVIYPIPPKLFLPNDDRRRPKSEGQEEMEEREKNRHRTVAEAVAEAEQQRWMTTYHSSNIDVIDQWQERQIEGETGGRQSSDVSQISVDLFTKESRFDQNDNDYKTMTIIKYNDDDDNIRWKMSVEMMIRNDNGTSTQWNYTRPRKMTMNEREEHRILNGNTYANYPENVDPSSLDPCYNYPLPKLHEYSTLQDCGRCPEGVGHIKESKAENPYHLHIKQQHETVQQMEARNRWRLLESQTPSHDIGALRRKMDLSSTKHQPEVFYDHEGRYQRERAGIYRTSYDPGLLRHSMNRLERCGAALTDTSTSHKNALDLPTDLNVQMAEIIRYNRSLCGSVAQPHSQPSQFEVYGPFEAAKALQKLHLQPDGAQADIRTQEGDVIWKQTTYGGDYNIPKFLQDHPPVPIHSRREPLELMSHCNQSIANIPLACPVVCRRPDTTPADPTPVRRDLSEYPASEARVLNSAAFLARQKEERKLLGTECTDRDQTTTSSRPNQCPPPHYDLSHRQSVRLHVPSFSCRGDTKSEMHRKFEQCFPSRAPDLRENNCQGKRHNFQCGINSQVLRGATLVTG